GSAAHTAQRQAIGGSKLVLRETPDVVVQGFMAARSKRLAVAACQGQAASAGVVNVTLADAVREAAIHPNTRVAQVAPGPCLNRAVGPAADVDPIAQAALNDQAAEDDVRGVFERQNWSIQSRDGHRRSPIVRRPEEDYPGGGADDKLPWLIQFFEHIQGAVAPWGGIALHEAIDVGSGQRNPVRGGVHCRNSNHLIIPVITPVTLKPDTVRSS